MAASRRQPRHRPALNLFGSNIPVLWQTVVLLAMSDIFMAFH